MTVLDRNVAVFL